VAVVINAYDTSRGGVERYADTLTRGLLGAGHAVHLIASRGVDLPEGAVLHRVNAATFWSPVKTWSFAVGAARVLEQERGAWDAVLGLARTPRQDVYRVGAGSHRAYLRATSTRVPGGLGEVLARLNPRHAAHLAMERRIFGAWRSGDTQRYLFNARRVRDEIVADYDVPPERIDILYNPVDTERFDPDRWRGFREETRRGLGVPQEAYTLLFAGGGFHRKGLDGAIAALAASRGAPWLVVAGGGDPGPYRRLARARGVLGRVIFAGLRPDIEALYTASDALMAPTRYDAFSNATLEAMAMGLPAITTRDNGASEVITEGREGFVVDSPEDAATLGRAVDALADPAVRREIGGRARARVASLSPRAHAEALIKILESAVRMRDAGEG
jgi:UDP-glucose:(heptosyl)LPS alpha-1,3-glucosyltransferase